MKRIIKLIIMAFILLVVTGCTTNTKYSSQGFVYNLVNDGKSYAVVGFTEDYYNRIIPDEYNGLPVTELYTSALENSQMEKIKIGKNVDTIGWYVFSNCLNLNYIEVDKDNKYFKSDNGILYDYDMKELICYPSSLKGSTFVLPTTVTSLGYFAFENNKNLEEVTLNDNITIIEGSCFYKAKKLKTINKMDNVKEITRYAFYDCEKLENIVFSNTLNTIGAYAFANCTSLKSLTINENVETIGAFAFIGCSSLIINCSLIRRPNTWNRDWNGGTTVSWAKN